MIKKFLTLTSLLQERAKLQPDKIAYEFLYEYGEDSITYHELDNKAKKIASKLQRMGATGERALLLYPPGLEYIAAFFGCLYSGTIAVPAYPPHPNRPMPRLQAIIADASAKFALTNNKLYKDLEKQFDKATGLSELKWVSTDKLQNLEGYDYIEAKLTEDTLAFLQYTSGSTSLPKGVMLTHGNLLDNLAMIQEAFQATTSSRGVIWLPPYHDMGLIGGILAPMYVGFPASLMAPVDFLQSPFRWLKAISEKKATISGGPNFAYEYAVQKVSNEQLKSLDLSNWKVAFNGAEPIRKDTLDNFSNYFGCCGFDSTAFLPCYGLAESALFVTGKKGNGIFDTFSVNIEALKLNKVIEEKRI